MKKKLYLGISIFAMILLIFSGIPHLIEGIQSRGMYKVNYGVVGFPLLISIIAFSLYKKQK